MRDGGWYWLEGAGWLFERGIGAWGRNKVLLSTGLNDVEIEAVGERWLGVGEIGLLDR